MKSGYNPIIDREPGSSSRRVRFSKPEADYLPLPDVDPETGSGFCNHDDDDDIDESTKRSAADLEMKIKNDVIVKQLKLGLCCFAVWAVLVVGFLVIAPSFF